LVDADGWNTNDIGMAKDAPGNINQIQNWFFCQGKFLDWKLVGLLSNHNRMCTILIWHFWCTCNTFKWGAWDRGPSQRKWKWCE
jgi:hypothetical protein